MDLCLTLVRRLSVAQLRSLTHFMSEFSESYHLRSNRTEDAVALLREAGIAGYVFPSSGEWTTFVAEGGAFAPDMRITAAAKQPLLHYVSAEDHGWSFALFEGGQLACGYSCSWDDEVRSDDSAYSKAYLERTVGVDAASRLEAVLHPQSIEDVFEQRPSQVFAESVGLTHFEWTAFDYIARDFAEGRADYPGLLRVE